VVFTEDFSWDEEVFDWVGNEHIPPSGIFEMEDWIKKWKVSINALVKENPEVNSLIFVAPRGSTLAAGKCVLTFNGSIQMEFSIPDNTPVDGSLVFSLSGNK
jgi:hypothetical protein